VELAGRRQAPHYRRTGQPSRGTGRPPDGGRARRRLRARV